LGLGSIGHVYPKKYIENMSPSRNERLGLVGLTGTGTVSNRMGEFDLKNKVINDRKAHRQY
jgi:hypothetical protein